MQLQITFDTAANRNAFAAKAGYAAADEVTLSIHASLYNMARAHGGFESASHVGDGGQAIVKAASVAGLDVVEDLGNGFHLVNTDDFVALFHTAGVDFAEPAESPIKLLSPLETTPITDPQSADAQWARIRVANRFRPFSESFSVDQVTPQRIPELIVVDSGINFDHPEFAGLATENFYKLSKFSSFNDEASGHGTAVASVAVGLNVGLTQNVKLVNVRVFSATEKPSLLELGQTMDAILARHVADTGTARVVNMSWNTPKSAYLESKIQALLDAGVFVVAAAGNEGIDVAGLTPAGMAQVITVGASDQDDVAAGFNDFAAADAGITTNAGQFLDVFAPGVLVAVAKTQGGYGRASGTSFSAGYVSGSLAAMLAMAPSWPQSFSIVLDHFIGETTKGVLLLDPQKFSENQNRIVHLPQGTGPSALGFDYYLGTVKQGEPAITGNMQTLFNVFYWDGETVNYEIVWDDAALEADYASAVSVDATGNFTINVPTATLPSDTNIKLVRFQIRAFTASASTLSNGLIFFHVNPNYDGSVSTEVASALEDLNSQSFFAAWIAYSLK